MLTAKQIVPQALPGFESIRRYRDQRGHIVAKLLPGDFYVTREEEVLDTVPEYMRLVTRGAGTGIVWPALLRKMDRLDPGFRD